MHPGSNALDDATIVKLTRTLAIIPITLVLGIVMARKENGADESASSAQATAAPSSTRRKGPLGNFSLKRAFPCSSCSSSGHIIPTAAVWPAGADAAVFAPLKTLSKFFIVMAGSAIFWL